MRTERSCSTTWAPAETRRCGRVWRSWGSRPSPVTDRHRLPHGRGSVTRSEHDPLFFQRAWAAQVGKRRFTSLFAEALHSIYLRHGFEIALATACPRDRKSVV